MSIKQDGNTFTARDFQLLAAAMDSTKAPIEVHSAVMGMSSFADCTKGQLQALRREGRVQRGSVCEGLLERAEEEDRAAQLGRRR